MNARIRGWNFDTVPVLSLRAQKGVAYTGLRAVNRNWTRYARDRWGSKLQGEASSPVEGKHTRGTVADKRCGSRVV